MAYDNSTNVSSSLSDDEYIFNKTPNLSTTQNGSGKREMKAEILTARQCGNAPV